MFARPLAADPTRTLDISELRAPNEFDVRLLEEEGVRYGDVTVRGGRLVPESAKHPEPAPSVEIPWGPRPQEHAAVCEGDSGLADFGVGPQLAVGALYGVLVSMALCVGGLLALVC